METNQATGLRLPEVEAARAAHGSNALPQPGARAFFSGFWKTSATRSLKYCSSPWR